MPTEVSGANWGKLAGRRECRDEAVIPVKNASLAARFDSRVDSGLLARNSQMDDEKPSDNDLVIGVPGRVLVVIKPDGRLVYGPSYTPDEAAAALWEALARKRVEAERGESNRIRLATKDEVALLEMEERFNEWEPAMVALAKADAAHEIAQTQRNQLLGVVPDTSAEMRRANTRVAQTQSEGDECVGRMAELARAHAKRKGLLKETTVLPTPEPDPKILN